MPPSMACWSIRCSSAGDDPVVNIPPIREQPTPISDTDRSVGPNFRYRISARLQIGGELPSGARRQRHQREGWVLLRAGREATGVGHDDVGYVERPVPLVHDAERP